MEKAGWRVRLLVLLVYDRKWKRCRTIIKLLFKYDDDPREIFPHDLSGPLVFTKKGSIFPSPFSLERSLFSRTESFFLNHLTKIKSLIK